MRVLMIGNTKGGVGKTTIATNLAVLAVNDGLRVVLVDADPQGSAAAWRALRGKDDIMAVQMLKPTLHQDVKRFNADLVIIDAGGRDGAVFRSGIMAADVLVIPINPSQYDVWAGGDVVDILAEARVYREDVRAFFVLNQVVYGTNVSAEAESAIKQVEGVQLLETVLHNRVAFKKIDDGLGVTEVSCGDAKAQGEISALWEEVKGILNFGGAQNGSK